MKIEILAVVAGSLLLPGCAHRSYDRPGMTQAELDRDWKACADETLRIENTTGGMMRPVSDPELLTKPCMERKGYRQVFLPAQ